MRRRGGVDQVTRELAIYDSTLWNWTKHARIDRGEREGLTSDERAESRFFLPLAGEVAERSEIDGVSF
ncbi:MAG TPA: hypothetical protein ENG94_04630, partial [Actinobacteria bacterium]|nr:hypothetical protein [Actinomycetota bacterium]